MRFAIEGNERDNQGSILQSVIDSDEGTASGVTTALSIPSLRSVCGSRNNLFAEKPSQRSAIPYG
jgi:hypothetical protein